MAELRYKFTNDTLFKMVFVEYPDLLKRLVARILNIPFEHIKEFTIKNSEMPPEELGGKLCRLDINMSVDGRVVDLEIQVNDEHDFPERSLYNWAREYSSALAEGHDYISLPETIVISILAFPMFECKEFYSEIRPLEVTRGTLLTKKMCLCYFELPKIPAKFDESDELNWWMTLFNAKTDEEMSIIKSKGGPVMAQAVEAYNHVSATEKFKQLERMRSDARHHEIAVYNNGQRQRAIKIAQAMKDEGMDISTISRLTELAIDDILQL